jgi:hypothetical protein
MTGKYLEVLLSTRFEMVTFRVVEDSGGYSGTAILSTHSASELEPRAPVRLRRVPCP